MSNINPDIYASENRETAGRSPKVIQQIKFEVKSPLTKTSVLIEKVSDVAKTFVTKGVLQIKQLYQSCKFYEYVQSFSINPHSKIVLATEAKLDYTMNM